jgi:SAM-dependent methyltransferase
MPDVPPDVSRLASRPNEAAPATEIGFLHAAHFFHTRIENFQPPAYYEDYLMTATYSQRMQAHQEAQAERLAGIHGSARSFIEIGCGDGSFLRHAARHVGRVVGIEASRAFIAEVRAAGFEVVAGYVGSAKALTEEKFDLFAARQVFEHLPDPVDVLAAVRQMLRPGAVGLIEVPNGFRSLREGRFYEFFPDHVQYYSANSLAGLATRVGLNVIEVREAFGGDYLELWLRHEPGAIGGFSSLIERRRKTLDALTEAVRCQHAENHAPVMIWGAGAKTLSIWGAAQDGFRGGIQAIIDSDPHKHGRFAPNSAVPVLAPEAAAALEPRAVLVLALSYREEIARLVREKLPSVQRILTVNDVGEIASL